jgi:PEP-CTERM/exosortase A-associated glycosyltransferase
MRILHVLDHSLPVQSGYTFRSAAIIREQRRLGWQTVQLTGPKHGQSAAALEAVDGIDYFRTPPLPAWSAVVPFWNQLDVIAQLRRRLRGVIASQRPDIIQAHSPCLNGLAALGLGLPVVYEMRSSWEDAAVSSGTSTEGSARYRLSRWLETQVLRRADAVTTICEGLRAEAVARGVPSARVSVVPNAVDEVAFAARAGNAPEIRRRFGLDGCTVVGFIGSFFAWEGLSMLVAALPMVLQQRSDVRVLLVGGGDEEAALRETVRRLQLERHVMFAGRAPHVDVPSFYDAIDVLAYPRLPIRLTEMVTPLKPLEAMALGKAVVASDVGGHREIIEDGVTGVLFRAGDAASLATAILRVAGDPPLLQRLREAGPPYVRRERTWAGVVPRYQAVYERVLAEARS